MGKENDAMLDYLNNNYRFAALFNGCFFGGEEVVKAAEKETRLSGQSKS